MKSEYQKAKEDVEKLRIEAEKLLSDPTPTTFEDYVDQQFRSITRVLRSDQVLDNLNRQQFKDARTRDFQLLVCVLITLAISLVALFK